MKSEDDIAQLCEVGDTLYRVSKLSKDGRFYVEPITITKAEFIAGFSDYSGHWYYRDNKNRSYFNRNIRSSCYKTEEDAEKEIVKRHHISLKRRLLKNYEKKLNETFDIGDHYIIK